MSYTLSDFGLLRLEGSHSNSNVMLFSVLVDRYKKSTLPKSLSYDKESGLLELRIEDEHFTIKLDSVQRFKLDKGISSSSVNQIRGLLQYDEDRFYLEQVLPAAKKGILPADSKGMKIYLDYLKGEMKRTRAEISKKVAYLSWPVASFAATCPVFWYTIEHGAEWLLAAVLAVSLSVDFVSVWYWYDGIMKYLNGDRLETIPKLKELMAEYKDCHSEIAFLKDFAKEIGREEALYARPTDYALYSYQVSCDNLIKRGFACFDSAFSELSGLPEEDFMKYKKCLDTELELFRNTLFGMISRNDLRTATLKPYLLKVENRLWDLLWDIKKIKGTLNMGPVINVEYNTVLLNSPANGVAPDESTPSSQEPELGNGRCLRNDLS